MYQSPTLSFPLFPQPLAPSPLKAHPLRAAFLREVRHDLVAEIFERRGNRQRRSLPETADRGELHGLGQLADQVNFSGLGLATCSAVENLDDFVAAHPARDAFAARLVAEKHHH